jgi:glutamate 5-kinase
VIARASRDNVLAAAVGGEPVGTTFAGHDRRLNARKLWIAFAAEVKGVIVVDDGARDALTRRGTSLLPAGVREVTGQFVEGDTVDVAAESGEVFARGMVFATSGEVRGAMGRRTSELPDGMTHEVIHRDDLVVL